MLTGRAAALAILVVAVAMAAPPGPDTMRVIALLVGVVPVVVGPRLVAERLVETAASGVALAAGLIIARFTASDVPITGSLGDRAVLLGLPMLLLASTRAMMRAPVFGARVTLAAGLVALVAAGRVNQGFVFPVASVLFVALALVALRDADPTRAAAADLSPRHRNVVVAAFGLGLGLTVTLGLTLPPLYAGMLDRLGARWLKPRAGFSESMTLGSLAGLYQSDRVVLRVRGEVPTHLRGMVWDGYNGRRWEAKAGLEPREVVETPTDVTAGETQIEYAGTPERYFAPLGADHVASSGGVIDRDAYGALWVNEAISSKRLAFDRGQVAPARGANETDLTVPRYLAPTLDDVLRRWGVSRELPPAERVRRIRARLLADYTYSVEVARDPSNEPVIDFLTNVKAGHCEYFASAFVLLARRAEVPARLVGGYLVAERSPLGYAIVRDRHAHAWAEVWVDEAWHTEDATPPLPLGAADPETGLASALFDGLRTSWEVVDDWLGRRTAFEFAMVLVVLGFGWLLMRALRGRRPRGSHAAPVNLLPELPGLLEALERRGVPIGPADTLARISERLADHAVPGTPAVQGALREVEAHVYGGVGEEGDVRARLVEVTRELGAP